MNFLDVRTVIISQFVTDAVCTAVLAFLWVQNRKRFGGTFYWLLDLAFQTAAVLLIALRGSIPDWVSMGFSSALVLAGALSGYIGLARFVGKSNPQIHNYILLAAFVAVHLYFLFVQPDLAARNLNVSVGLLIFCFQCMWLVLRRVDRGMRRITQWVGLVFGLFCLVSIGRIVVILVNPNPGNDFFKTGTYDTLLLMSYQLLLILLTFGLALMVNQRLLKEIQTQEEKFTKAFHASPYAVTLTRASDGRMLEVNDGFVAITGYSCAEVVGKTTLDLQLWAREVDRAAVVDELSHGRRVLGRESQFRRKSGEMLTGLFSADVIMIDDQPWILSSISDITERKQAEQKLAQYSEHLEDMAEARTRELRDAQEQLVRHERLAVLGQMAGSVGHELRNPLAVISNAVYFLKLAQPDAGDQVKDYLDIVERQVRTAERIITDLLDFARVQSVAPEPVVVAELVRQALERFPPPPSVRVSLALPAGLPPVYADPRQVIQVLGNLVVNACQAMPEGGALTVAARREADMIAVAVTDTGVGIPPENMRKLFEPLFTTKAKGIGLGLAVSRKLAEANGGRIEVQSEPGKGSTFTLSLPVDSASLPSTLARPCLPAGDSLSLPGHKVL